MMKYLNKI